MTASGIPTGPNNITSGGWCTIHGQFFGYQCGMCSSAAPYVAPVVTVPSPLTGTEAISALVRAYDTLLTDLRRQLDEANRHIAELVNERDS